jgi:hypothetical protein
LRVCRYITRCNNLSLPIPNGVSENVVKQNSREARFDRYELESGFVQDIRRSLVPLKTQLTTPNLARPITIVTKKQLSDRTERKIDLKTATCAWAAGGLAATNLFFFLQTPPQKIDSRCAQYRFVTQARKIPDFHARVKCKSTPGRIKQKAYRS